ncbi:MAG: DUF6935 domain-containing protein [Candidatus Hodarchaeota archaeon]
MNKAKSSVSRSVKSSVGRATSKAKQGVRQKMTIKKDEFLKNLKKVNKEVKGKIITDFDEFKESWESKADDPAQSILHYLIGAYNYVFEDKQVGEYMCTVVLAKTFLLPDNKSPTGYKLNPKGDLYFLEHMAETPRTIKSYLGGNPDNNYDMDPENITMKVVGEQIDKANRFAKIFVQSGGKDFQSPSQMRLNGKNQWKIFEISSIATGVQDTEEEKWDF